MRWCFAFLAGLAVTAAVTARNDNFLDKALAPALRTAAIKATANNKKFSFKTATERGWFQLVEPEKNLTIDLSGTSLTSDTLTSRVKVVGKVAVDGELKNKGVQITAKIQVSLVVTALVEAKLMKQNNEYFVKVDVKTLTINVDKTKLTPEQQKELFPTLLERACKDNAETIRTEINKALPKSKIQL